MHNVPKLTKFYTSNHLQCDCNTLYLSNIISHRKYSIVEGRCFTPNTLNGMLPKQIYENCSESLQTQCHQLLNKKLGHNLPSTDPASFRRRSDVADVTTTPNQRRVQIGLLNISLDSCESLNTPLCKDMNGCLNNGTCVTVENQTKPYIVKQ